MPSAQTLTFDEFRALIAKELQLDPAAVTPEASFVEDLMVDSIRMVDLMLRLEEMGIILPAEAVWDVRTVGDAYRVLTEAGGKAGAAPAEARAG